MVKAQVSRVFKRLIDHEKRGREKQWKIEMIFTVRF